MHGKLGICLSLQLIFFLCELKQQELKWTFANNVLYDLLQAKPCVLHKSEKLIWLCFGNNKKSAKPKRKINLSNVPYCLHAILIFTLQGFSSPLPAFAVIVFLYGNLFVVIISTQIANSRHAGAGHKMAVSKTDLKAADPTSGCDWWTWQETVSYVAIQCLVTKLSRKMSW